MRYRYCGKRRYRSRVFAELMRDETCKRTGQDPETMAVYICYRCLAFHVGHKREEREDEQPAFG